MEEFYWPGVYDEVRKLGRGCLECQRASKHHLPPAPLQPFPIVDTPFKRIGMDLTGTLPTTAEGNSFVLVIMDYATRWPEAIALRTPESTTISDQLMILFNRTGIGTASHYNPIYLRLCTDLAPSTKMRMAYRDRLGKQTRKAVRLNFQRKVRGGMSQSQAPQLALTEKGSGCEEAQIGT